MTSARALADRFRFLINRGNLTLLECDEIIKKLPEVIVELDKIAYPTFTTTMQFHWLPIETRPLPPGIYLVGQRRYQEIMRFHGPERGWLRRNVLHGWQRDDPVERFNATHCVLIQAPE